MKEAVWGALRIENVIQTEPTAVAKFSTPFIRMNHHTATIKKQPYCIYALMKWISLSAILQKESMTLHKP
jgi:hypothetical protein